MITKSFQWVPNQVSQAAFAYLKFSNGNTRVMGEICSKLTVKTQEWQHDVFFLPKNYFPWNLTVRKEFSVSLLSKWMPLDQLLTPKNLSYQGLILTPLVLLLLFHAFQGKMRNINGSPSFLQGFPTTKFKSKIVSPLPLLVPSIFLVHPLIHKFPPLTKFSTYI